MIHKQLQYIIKSDDICEVGMHGIQFHIPRPHFILGFYTDTISFEMGSSVYLVSLLEFFVIFLASYIVLLMSDRLFGLVFFLF